MKTTQKFVTTSDTAIRTLRKTKARFEQDLPLAKIMFEIADLVNKKHGRNDLGSMMHGAARVATDAELKMLLRVLRVQGLEAHGYYDLRKGVYVESTVSRPVTREAIDKCGWRMFLSRLDINQVPKEYRPMVQKIIDRRKGKVFTRKLIALVKAFEKQNGLTSDQADEYADEVANLFGRPEKGDMTVEEYDTIRRLSKSKKPYGEVFKVVLQVLTSTHPSLNHMTPSVASVEEAQAMMLEYTDQGITPIPVYQGPVGVDILLRQTSCKAPAVWIKLKDANGVWRRRKFNEAFIEFEERHAATTPLGRLMYDESLDLGKKMLKMRHYLFPTADDPPEYVKEYADAYYDTMRMVFNVFPKTFEQQWRAGLVYAEYSLTNKGKRLGKKSMVGRSIYDLYDEGYIDISPITYQDFLPKSAGGIFASNIGLIELDGIVQLVEEDQKRFEKGIGQKVINFYTYYANIENSSAQEYGIQDAHTELLKSRMRKVNDHVQKAA